MERANKKEFIVNLCVILCGIIAMWVVISHMAHFSYPDYSYRNNLSIKLMFEQMLWALGWIFLFLHI